MKLRHLIFVLFVLFAFGNCELDKDEGPPVQEAITTSQLDNFMFGEWNIKNIFNLNDSIDLTEDYQDLTLNYSESALSEKTKHYFDFASNINDQLFPADGWIYFETQSDYIRSNRATRDDGVLIDFYNLYENYKSDSILECILEINTNLQDKKAAYEYRIIIRRPSSN